MNRSTEGFGSDLFAAASRKLAIPKSLRAILDYFDDAGADRFGEFEAAVRKAWMNRSTEGFGRLICGCKPQVGDTKILRAILDHQHDAGVDWFGEFKTEITR